MEENKDIKRKKKKSISLKLFIFISIVFVAFLSLLIIWLSVVSIFKRETKKQILSATENKCMTFAADLCREGYIDLENVDIAIKQLAPSKDGRVMIIDHNFVVMMDSANDKNGSYIVASDIVKVMNGSLEKVSHLEENKLAITVPIVIEGTVNGVVTLSSSVSYITDGSVKIFNGVLIFVAIAMIVAIILAQLIARTSVKALNKINKQISHVSEGYFDYTMPEKGFKETKILASNYNAVLTKLAMLDSSRQEFVSNVSHELKTPITSMKVLAESLVSDENATVETYQEFMSDIVEEIDRESKIINDLLILVKTDQKKSSLEFTNADINELLDIIVKRVTPLAKQRNIEIAYESYREIKADVDEVKISLVFSNLIENAIKYNVENGSVKVSLNADAKYFYVKVADTGVGIPDDAKDMVFERFYRVDKARSRDTGGTGLGLAIAKSQVQAHGGSIKLYSESGKGTTFTVKIPLVHEEEEGGDKE